MPEPVSLPKTDSPLAALTAGVEAHAAVLTAQRQLGAELAQLAPPPPVPPIPGEPA